MTKTMILKDPAIILGQGYITDKQAPSSWECFIGSTNFTGGGSSIVKLDNSVSFEEVQNTLNIDVTAKAGIGPFKGSTSANYVRDIQEDHYSQGFYYYEQFFLPTQVWHPAGFATDMLSTIGQGVYKQGSEQFRLTCGDSVVTQIQEGVSLYVSMKLVFESYSDKQTFQVNAGGKFGSLASVSAEVQKMVAQYDLNGNVEVTALQIGGDVTKLPQIFAKDNNGYYVTSCSLQDLQDCQNTVTGILNYAINNLPSQINGTNGELLSYELGSLEYMGLNLGNSTVTPDVLAARTWLGETYINQTAQQVFVSHLLASPFMSTNCIEAIVFNELSLQEQNLQYNLNILQNPESGVINCYNNPLDCISTKESLQAQLQQVNGTFIDQFNTGYFENGINSEGGHGYLVYYPSGNNQFLVTNDQRLTPPSLVAYITLGETTLNLIAYFNFTMYDCGPAKEMLPEFPFRYNVTYEPGSEYYECFQTVFAPTNPGAIGLLTYDIIDNPL